MPGRSASAVAPDGMFGENLTTTDLDVDGALVGETVGSRRRGRPGGVRRTRPLRDVRAPDGRSRMAQEVHRGRRSGAYLSIESGGTVRPGDAIEVLTRPAHDVTVEDTFRAFMGDLDVARHVVAGDCLPEDEADWLRDLIARRTAEV